MHLENYEAKVLWLTTCARIHKPCYIYSGVVYLCKMFIKKYMCLDWSYEYKCVLGIHTRIWTHEESRKKNGSFLVAGPLRGRVMGADTDHMGGGEQLCHLCILYMWHMMNIIISFLMHNSLSRHDRSCICYICRPPQNTRCKKKLYFVVNCWNNIKNMHNFVYSMIYLSRGRHT